MRRLAQRLACGSFLLGLIACASLAGVDGDTQEQAPPDSSGEPPPSTNGGTSGSSSDSDASTSSGGTSSSGGTQTDAGEDTETPDPSCTLRPNDAECAAPAECCSNSCNEDHRCHSTCHPTGGLCDFTAGNDCCIGSYCKFGVPTCRACILPGEESDSSNPKSCCSGRLELGGISFPKKCAA